MKVEFAERGKPEYPEKNPRSQIEIDKSQPTCRLDPGSKRWEARLMTTTPTVICIFESLNGPNEKSIWMLYCGNWLHGVRLKIKKYILRGIFQQENSELFLSTMEQILKYGTFNKVAIGN